MSDKGWTGKLCSRVPNILFWILWELKVRLVLCVGHTHIIVLIFSLPSPFRPNVTELPEGETD